VWLLKKLRSASGVLAIGIGVCGEQRGIGFPQSSGQHSLRLALVAIGSPSLGWETGLVQEPNGFQHGDYGAVVVVLLFLKPTEEMYWNVTLVFGTPAVWMCSRNFFKFAELT
jgi:hypothetical protein